MDTLNKPNRRTLVILLLTVVYFIVGKLGLKLAFVHASATAVWPATGLTLAAFLLLGYSIWPGILLGAFLVNLTTAGSIATSIGIAIGNTLEGVAGCYLVQRFSNGRNSFETVQGIFKFAFCASMVSTALSATIGVTTLSLAGYADWAKFGPIWLTWWLGDAVGSLVVTPLLLLWIANPRVRWTWELTVEASMLSATLLVVSWSIFSGSFESGVKNYPLEFLCIPPVIWAAFRLGRRATATAVFALAAVATWGTLHGYGPFARESQNTSLLLLGSFIGIMAMMKLAIAAEVRERRRAEERVRQLASSDPLTGLANYRRLIDVLDLEIKRSGRSGRPFGLLLLDLDGLKTINDRYGHLTGTKAVCRLAAILRVHCRGIDTAGRYGGDEFALVLPETGASAAREVADRITARLADDQEKPRLSASVGVALFPQDGDTVEALLGAADRNLYENKRRSGEDARPRIASEESIGPHFRPHRTSD